MLPIVLTPGDLRVAVTGAGEALNSRLAMLQSAGISPARLEATAVSDQALASLRLLFVAGLEEGVSRELATRARRARVLVNVEDMPHLCDFHVPAQVRRGDLLLTVSTGGRSPGLSGVLRELLEEKFGAEWESRLDGLAQARARWRAAGLAPAEVARQTRAFLDGKGWLE